MHDISVEIVKEGHKKYFNVVGRIKWGKYKAEAAYKRVPLSVQSTEGQRKFNEVVNVDYIDEAAEIHGADSIELFENQFELVRGSTDIVSDKTKKRMCKNKSKCHTFYQYNNQNRKGWDTGRFNSHLVHISSNEKITKVKRLTNHVLSLSYIYGRIINW